jgi:hypothetical protein
MWMNKLYEKLSDRIPEKAMKLGPLQGVNYPWICQTDVFKWKIDLQESIWSGVEVKLLPPVVSFEELNC